MSKESSVDEMRKQIEKVTLEIFNLCSERVQLAKQLGKIKAKKGIPVENMKIEQEIRKKILEQGKKNGLDEGFCLNLLQLLFEESKQVQRDIIKLQH